ncbi:diacylglycerol kinase family protein [Rubidibacter lacunae]|nr:diacylglycerol kinase family protein [Rubidibacter lacunae]
MSNFSSTAPRKGKLAAAEDFSRYVPSASVETEAPRGARAERSERRLAWKVAPNLLVSFRYAWAGVHYAFVTQRNFRIHCTVGVLALALGAFLQVGTVELAVVGLTAALVMVLELLNTAIESVVDLTVRQTYHELAKTAKDCAAGAVLIAAIASVVVAGLILLPPLATLVLGS